MFYSGRSILNFKFLASAAINIETVVLSNFQYFYGTLKQAFLGECGWLVIHRLPFTSVVAAGNAYCGSSARLCHDNITGYGNELRFNNCDTLTWNTQAGFTSTTVMFVIDNLRLLFYKFLWSGIISYININKLLRRGNVLLHKMFGNFSYFYNNVWYYVISMVHGYSPSRDNHFLIAI